MVFWEVASSGHVDGAALPLIVLALFLHPPQAGGHWIALAGATLIKLYPLPFPRALPSECVARLEDAGDGDRFVAAGYACYASVGRQVLGFLPEYAREEGLDPAAATFSSPWCATSCIGHAPHRRVYGFAALLLLGLALWAWIPARRVRCLRFAVPLSWPRPSCCSSPPTTPGTTCGCCRSCA